MCFPFFEERTHSPPHVLSLRWFTAFPALFAKPPEQHIDVPELHGMDRLSSAPRRLPPVIINRCAIRMTLRRTSMNVKMWIIALCGIFLLGIGTLFTANFLGITTGFQ